MMNSEVKKEMWTVVRDALLTVAGAAIIAVTVNLVRSDSLPFVAKEAYDILVPCPEPGGDAVAMTPEDEALRRKSTFVVDARDKSDFAVWHYPNALNLTYDYLDPTPNADIEALAKAIAKSRASLVAVYGDGDEPDTGEQLAKEISFKGIKNVHFIKGGAPSLKAVNGGRP